MLVFIGSLLVVALFSALIAPLFIDWTNYRQDFEREASRLVGQPVAVNGEARARLLPFPSLSFTDIEVGRNEDGGPMLEIDSFSMDAELAPFLSGEFRIFDMRIERPQLRLTLAEDGTLDWAARDAATLGPVSRAFSDVVLERVAISDGSMVVRDAQAGRTYTVSELDGQLSADALTGPWRMEGTAALDGERGAFSISTGAVDDNGVVRIRSRLLPDAYPLSIELEGDGEVADERPRYAGGFTVQAFDPDASDDAANAGLILRGTGDFEATNERLRIGEYRMEVGGSEDPYIVTGEATIDAGSEPEFLLLADGQQIDIDRLDGGSDSAEGTAEAEAAAPISLDERVATFRRLIERIPIPDLPGRASLVLPAVVVGETTLRDVSIDARPDGTGWRVDRFSAEMPGRTRVEASGALSLGDDFGFAGDLVLASNQPSGFASWLSDEVPPEIRSMASAGFEASVDLRRSLQRFENLELIVGETRLAGRFERLDDGGTPALSFDLAGDRVDLGAVRAFAGLLAGDETLRLGEHDLAARLRAARFDAFGLQLGDIETALTLRGGLLDIDRLSIGDLEGASITGEAVLSEWMVEPQGEAAFTVSAADPADLLALIAERTGDTVDMSRLAENAELFAETDLRADMQLGSARESAAPGTTGGFDLDLSGVSGGSSVTLTIASESSLADGLDAPLSLSLEADNPRTDRLLAQSGLDVLPFDLGGPAALYLTLDGHLTQSAAVDLAFEAPTGQLDASGDIMVSDGRVESGALSVAIDADDIEPFVLLAGGSFPDFGQGVSLSLQSDVAIADEAITLSAMTGDLGGNGFRSDFDLTRSDTPELTGRLSLDAIDAGWLAEAIAGRQLVQFDGERVVWSSEEFADVTPLPLGVSIALDATEATFGHNEAARGLTAELTYDAGALQLDDIAADWIGGRLTGSLLMSNAGGEGAIFRAQADLEQGFIARALAGEAIALGSAGLVDATIALDGTGRTAEALVGGLSGSGTLEVADFQITGLEDEALPAILQAADGFDGEIEADVVEEIARDAVLAGLTIVDRATLPVTVAAGVARIPAVLLQTPAMTVRGDVAVGLADRMVDGDFQAAYSAGEEELPGATPAVDLRFSGALDAPQRDLDATELANFLSLRAFERERRRVERVQASVLEKQRLRREAAYWREQERLRREARLEREAEEAERRQREEEARDRRQEEERQAAEEAARRAAEAEAEARALAEEAARRRAEEQAEAEAEARERARARAQAAEAEEEPAIEAGEQPAFSFDAIEAIIEGLDEEERSEAPAPSGSTVEEGPPLPAPEAPLPPSPALDFDDLPGVEQ